MPREQIRDEWKVGIDRAKLFSFKNMVRRQENFGIKTICLRAYFTFE
jgi:hypothetical protein